MENKFTKGEWRIGIQNDDKLYIYKNGSSFSDCKLIATIEDKHGEGKYNALLMQQSNKLLDTLFMCVNMLKCANYEGFIWSDRVLKNDLITRAEQLIKDVTTLP